MLKYKVQTAEHGMAYLVDCTLATVARMACKKKRPAGEFTRQISIAQTGVDWMRQFGVDFSTTRAHEVVADYKGSVKSWAAQ